MLDYSRSYGMDEATFLKQLEQKISKLEKDTPVLVKTWDGTEIYVTFIENDKDARRVMARGGKPMNEQEREELRQDIARIRSVNLPIKDAMAEKRISKTNVNEELF